jgi:hypothetical protein
MALEEFEKQQELNGRDKVMVQMRSITNYVMGAFILFAGFVFFFPTAKTQPFLEKYDPTIIKTLAIVCWIYGIFRIYRGYKKNYFRES